MAVRKDAVKKQMEEFLQGQLGPNEALRGGALAQSGPLPGLFGLIGMLFIKQYYVGLTSDRVVFVRASQLSGKPTAVEFADDRDGARVERGKDGTFWSTFAYHGSRTVKLRYHKIWREEMNVVLQGLAGEAAA